MNQDEIIAMAREAGLDVHFPGFEAEPAVFGRCTSDTLQRFAAMVAAKEHEKQAVLIARAKQEAVSAHIAMFGDVEQAVAAEREACAELAYSTFKGNAGQAVNLAVATAIRARSAA